MGRLADRAWALLRDDSGQTLIEYELILLLVSAALVGGLILFRGSLMALYQFIQSSWPVV